MKIIRNEQEIELTTQELWQAFREQEKKNHMQDIEYELEELGEEATQEEKEEMLERYEDHLTNYEEWRYLLQNIINDVLGD